MMTSSRFSYRTITRPLFWAGVFLALPVLLGQSMVRAKMAEILTPPSAPPDVPLPAFRVHDPNRPTAVFLLGDGHTEASDFMGPYEVLAASGAYNVYAIADERRPAALFPGEIDVLPHFSLREYDEQIGASPDIIVLPYMEGGDPAAHARLENWLRERWQDRTLLLTICAGSYIAAEAGLLDDRAATSHRSVLDIARESHPEVRWVDGLRYVDDGNLISSAGITSGVDAALYALQREQGRSTAEAAARSIRYPQTKYLDDPAFTLPSSRFATLLLNAAFAPRTDIGLVLYDGASELTLAAWTDTYPRTFAARLRTVAPLRGYVSTRYGLQIAPRWTFEDLFAFERIVVAGEPTASESNALEDWAASRGVHLETTATAGYPYDATLSDLAARYSAATAVDAAGRLEYPVEHLGIRSAGVPGMPLTVFAGLGLLGVAVTLALRRGVLALRVSRNRE